MSGMQPMGELIDSLGIAHCPEEGELVASAVVLLKIIDNDGGTNLRIAASDGMTWIDRVGMLRSAELIETSWIRNQEDDE